MCLSTDTHTPFKCRHIHLKLKLPQICILPRRGLVLHCLEKCLELLKRLYLKSITAFSVPLAPLTQSRGQKHNETIIKVL